MRLSVASLRELIKEELGNVVSLGQARAKRSLFVYEMSVRQFLEAWDESTERFAMLRASVPDSERPMLETLLREYETAGKNLSVFLRGLRLRMKKGL